MRLFLLYTKDVILN